MPNQIYASFARVFSLLFHPWPGVSKFSNTNALFCLTGLAAEYMLVYARNKLAYARNEHVMVKMLAWG
jgi:hypothetical protein